MQPLAFVTFLRRDFITSSSFSEDSKQETPSTSVLVGALPAEPSWGEPQSSHPFFWGAVTYDLWAGIHGADISQYTHPGAPGPSSVGNPEVSRVTIATLTQRTQCAFQVPEAQ